MNRRELLGKLPILVIGPTILKAAACTTEIDGAPVLGGGGAGGTGGTGDDIDQFVVSNQDTSGHTHMFWIECDQRGAGPWTYIAEGASHTHEVALTAADLDSVFAGQEVTIQTTDGHPHTWIVRMPTGMCPPDGGGDDGSGGGGGGGGGGW